MQPALRPLPDRRADRRVRQTNICVAGVGARPSGSASTTRVPADLPAPRSERQQVGLDASNEPAIGTPLLNVLDRLSSFPSPARKLPPLAAHALEGTVHLHLSPGPRGSSPTINTGHGEWRTT